jgi:hypothetical protein
MRPLFAIAGLKRIHAEKRTEVQMGILMNNRVTTTQYLYYRPFGEVSAIGWNSSAWQDGNLIGTYQTCEKALEHLAWKERPKTKPHV